MKNKEVLLAKAMPVDLGRLVETRLLIQANSGGGKSWCIRRLLEQTHGQIQHIILDPEGEFSTLREKYDYILAGKGGDTPAEPKSAALLARKLLELRVSAVVDLYELSPQDRKRFVRLFCEAMVNAPKELYHEVLIVLDEAHVFVPEKGQSEAAGAVIDLCTRGRKRGFAAVLATQRISKLAKDAAAECNNKLIGRTSLDIDQKRAGEELGFTTKDQFHSLRTLEPGEFYAFGPALTMAVEKIKVGEVYTSHPKIGNRTVGNVIPPTSKIKKILGQLADLPEEAEKEATTISEYKEQNSKLRREISVLKKSSSSGLSAKEVENAVKKATEELHKIRFAEQGEWIKQIQNWFKILTGIADSIKQFETALKKQNHKIKTPETKHFVGVGSSNGREKTTFFPNSVVKTEKRAETIEVTDSGELSNPEIRILNAIAWFESVGIEEPEQPAVAFLAGYKFGGGAFNNPRGSLRSKGFVEYRGKSISLTELGKSVAEYPTGTVNQEALHEKVFSILPGPEQKLLRPLIDAYPNDLSNEELAEASGYVVNSGGFNNPRGRLRTLGLIEYPTPGRVRARDLLFF